MVPPDSDRVSRVRPYSGANPGSSTFRLRGYHPVSPIFPDTSAKSHCSFDWSYNPKVKNFGLGSSHFARRYYGNLILISLPLPTKMFQFGRCRFSYLCIQYEIMGNYSHWVAPFGNLRINASFQLAGAYRRYTRPSSPVDAKASTSSP